MTPTSLNRAFGFLAACAATACLTLASPASADVSKMIRMCEGQKLCPYFLPQLPVPPGWIIDEAATHKMRMTVLVPEGSDYARADALIYAKAFYNYDKTTVDQRVARSNDHWMQQVKDAKIVRLSDISGSRPGVPFQLFQYTNPGQAYQSAEIVAFGEDTDKEGNLYGVQVVLTARSELALAATKDTLFAVLKNY